LKFSPNLIRVGKTPQKKAIKQASKTVRNLKSIYIENFEAKEEKDVITSYRINAKISFLLDQH